MELFDQNLRKACRHLPQNHTFQAEKKKKKKRHCVVFAFKTSLADTQCTHNNSLLYRTDPRPGLQLEKIFLAACVWVGLDVFILAGGLTSSV